MQKYLLNCKTVYGLESKGEIIFIASGLFARMQMFFSVLFP